MNDQNQQAPQVPPIQPTGSQPSSEVEAGKAFAILSYALSLIGIPFFLVPLIMRNNEFSLLFLVTNACAVYCLVPLIMRNNEFSLYHAKQCLLLWLAAIAVGVVGGITTLICIGIVLLPAGAIFVLVLNIMGLINAINGQQKPLPLIGQYAEQWFKGITKV